MVVNIKNPSKIVLNEIQEWLSSKSYRCGYCFVVNLVYLNVSSKISPEDVAEFKKEFGEDIHLKGASYGANGSTSDFKYWCDHHLLDEFGNSIRNWLANQNLEVILQFYQMVFHWKFMMNYMIIKLKILKKNLKLNLKNIPYHVILTE